MVRKLVKRHLHTTIDDDAYKILKKYEAQFGNLNTVLKKALQSFDQSHHKTKVGLKSFKFTTTRIKTGDAGIDELLEGGIPEGFVVVVTGKPGTGKTTLALQFLVAGTNNNERGIYFSFEENAEQLAKHCLRFGWNIQKLIEDGLLELFGFTVLDFEDIAEIIDDYKPKRAVFDSMNVLIDPDEFRRSVTWRNLLKVLKRNQVVSLMLTEKKSGLDNLVFDEFDFMADGIFLLDRETRRQGDRYLLSIQKMRTTDINSVPRPFRFTKNGITLFPDEPVL